MEEVAGHIIELERYYLNNYDAGKNRITKKDKKILRELAKKKAEIASLDIQKEKVNLWKNLNSLKSKKPMIAISDIPWHEMNYNNELRLETEDNFSRYLETRLRRTLYLWNHMRVDMVVEPSLPCYMLIRDSGFNFEENTNTVITDVNSDIISREFKPQIKDYSDIQKMKVPTVIYDEKITMERFNIMQDIFNDILDIEKKGNPQICFSPWDMLIRWYGVQQLLTDLVLKPDFMHTLIEKYTDINLELLEYYQDNNLLALNNGNFRTGTGGLGYTKELPAKDYVASHIRTADMWGFSASQIFAAVSPKMHEEFAINYEIKWLEKFGLCYYGCCEPLDKKIDIVKKIPNLRKISMSPWVNLEKASNEIGTEFVFSYKPSPVIFIESVWDYNQVKKELVKNLSIIKNCHVEIIMRTISTTKYKPQRLWDWAKAVKEVVEEL